MPARETREPPRPCQPQRAPHPRRRSLAALPSTRPALSAQVAARRAMRLKKKGTWGTVSPQLLQKSSRRFFGRRPQSHLLGPQTLARTHCTEWYIGFSTLANPLYRAVHRVLDLANPLPHAVHGFGEARPIVLGGSRVQDPPNPLPPGLRPASGSWPRARGRWRSPQKSTRKAPPPSGRSSRAVDGEVKLHPRGVVSRGGRWALARKTRWGRPCGCGAHGVHRAQVHRVAGVVARAVHEADVGGLERPVVVAVTDLHVELAPQVGVVPVGHALFGLGSTRWSAPPHPSPGVKAQRALRSGAPSPRAGVRWPA